METVTFISHAAQSRLRTVVEKVSTIAQHRLDSSKVRDLTSGCFIRPAGPLMTTRCLRDLLKAEVCQRNQLISDLINRRFSFPSASNKLYLSISKTAIITQFYLFFGSNASFHFLPRTVWIITCESRLHVRKKNPPAVEQEDKTKISLIHGWRSKSSQHFSSLERKDQPLFSVAQSFCGELCPTFTTRRGRGLVLEDAL